MPVPGTTIPEPVPFEQVTLAALPSRSSTETCVVEPRRSAGPSAPAPGRRRPSAILVAAASIRSGATDRVRALGGQALDGVGELAEAEDLAGLEDVACRRVQGPAFGVVGEDQLQELVEIRLLLVHLHPLAGEPRRGRSEICERRRPEALEHRRNARRGPGDAAGSGSDVEDLRCAVEEDLDRHELRATLDARA